MYQNHIKPIRSKALIILGILALLASAMIPAMTKAAQITGRKVTLGSSAASESTTYTAVTGALPSATVLQSVDFVACTTASGSCTTPTGFTSGSSTLSSQPVGYGDAAGWTVDTSNTGKLRFKKTGNVAAPSGATSAVFGSVTNPSTTNTTFFLRMTTYSDDAWTTSVDSGVIAVSTSTTITVSGSVDEALTFCTGTSGITSSSCAGATGSSVSLGSLTTTSTGSGTSLFGITTNAGSGYVVTYNGATLTSGGNTISAIGGTSATSSQGTEQFGVNLKLNTTPSVGAEVAGAGSAVAASPYATADEFAFVAGSAQTMVNQGSSDAFRMFTVSYIANISASTEPGTYTTSVNYVATPTF